MLAVIDCTNIISITYEENIIFLTFWCNYPESAGQVQILAGEVRKIMRNSGFFVSNRAAPKTVYSRLITFLRFKAGRIYVNSRND